MFPEVYFFKENLILTQKKRLEKRVENVTEKRYRRKQKIFAPPPQLLLSHSITLLTSVLCCTLGARMKYRCSAILTRKIMPIRPLTTTISIIIIIRVAEPEPELVRIVFIYGLRHRNRNRILNTVPIRVQGNEAKN
jgi:hypothetical protein